MKKKEENIKKLAVNTNTYKIQKFDKNEEGEIISKYNKRTMAKKAEKAFKQGKRFYTYKGQQFAVPIIFKRNGE